MTRTKAPARKSSPGNFGSDRVVPNLNASLFRLAMSLPPTPRKEPKRPRGWSHGPTKITDAQVLDARTKFEFEGWSRRKVAEHFGRIDRPK